MTDLAAPTRTAYQGRIRGRWPLAFGIVLVAVPLLIAVFGALLAPHDPDASLGPPLAGPGTVGSLGTDSLGRDVMSRVLSGGRTTILIALGAAVTAELLGSAAGAFTALARPAQAAVVTYLTRVLLALPGILLLSALVSGFGSSPVLLYAAATVVLVPSLVPVIAARTRILALQPWLEAARFAGTGWPRLLLRELLPNLVPVMAADLATRFVTAVFLVSTAGFLGLGPAPPTPDWGVMISEAAPTLQQQPWPVIAPAALLGLLALGATLLTHRVIGRVTAGGSLG